MTRSILRSDAIFDILEEGFFWKSLFVLEERLRASFIFRPLYLDTSVSLLYFCFAFLIAVSGLLLINARTLHAKKNSSKLVQEAQKQFFCVRCLRATRHETTRRMPSRRMTPQILSSLFRFAQYNGKIKVSRHLSSRTSDSLERLFVPFVVTC